jgi:hypothetical protein
VFWLVVVVSVMVVTESVMNRSGMSLVLVLNMGLLIIVVC